MINQTQLFFLLLVTRAYISVDVQTMITGFQVVINPSEYIPFENIDIYKTLIGYFDYQLSNSMFNNVSINSDSSVYNTNSLLLWFIFIIISHFWILFVRIFLNSCRSEYRCSRLIKIIRWLTDKIFIFLTFWWYIRIVLEINQFLLFTSFYEIFNFHTSEPLQIASLIFAILLFIALILLIIGVSILSLSHYEVLDDKHNKLGELFRGIKMDRKSKIYVALLLIRRAFFVVILISMQSVNSRIVVGILSFFELIYLGAIIFIRPFKEAKSNIIEIVNEICFFIIFGGLIIFNVKADWNSIVSNMYIAFITSNSIVLFIIVVGNIIL